MIHRLFQQLERMGVDCSAQSNADDAVVLMAIAGFFASLILVSVSWLLSSAVFGLTTLFVFGQLRARNRSNPWT